MERSGNFYKAIQLGYILISILIGCMAYNSLYEWQEIEALELGNKKIDEGGLAAHGSRPARNAATEHEATTSSPPSRPLWREI